MHYRMHESTLHSTDLPSLDKYLYRDSIFASMHMYMSSVQLTVNAEITSWCEWQSGINCL